MGHSNIRIKVRRRRVANLRAISRKYTRKNINKTISPVVKHTLVDVDTSNAITCPFTKHKFVPTNPHPVPGKFGITITGYDWVEPEGKLWSIPKGGFKQVKSLRHSLKVRKFEHDEEGNKIIRIVKYKSEFPDYTLHKMNNVEYMEKLVEHKIVRWERKNPPPVQQNDEQQDMFEQEFMQPWRLARDTATERFRNAVISIYDKLQLTGRFKKDEHKYEEKLVAEIKDINGEGHRINDLPKTSKLIKKAQNITNSIHAKNARLMCTNLRDHKRTKGRIILPQAA